MSQTPQRCDVTTATDRQLAAWVRQYDKSQGAYDCYRGHTVCGCTNAAHLDGLAPCYDEVEAERLKRKYRKVDALIVAA